MAKKSRQKTVNPEIKAQREALTTLRRELTELHEISLIIMAEKGILPPLYGGEHLGDSREVIPLWGMADDDPELGALLLRLVPGVEPNADLQSERNDLGLMNDWPIADLLDTLVNDKGKPLVEGAEELRKLSMLFVLAGNQVNPAPGYDREMMIEHIADMKPYAVFPIIPTSGEGDTLTYLWDELDKFRAEVVYAHSPQLLEAAVWEYRVDQALQEEIDVLESEGHDPEEELIALDTAGISAMYDMLVTSSLRLYGTTSPVRSKQEELDVLRDEAGDLIIKPPLKPEVEPIPLLAAARYEANMAQDHEILRLKGDSPDMLRVWPQIRPYSHFCIRLRQGQYSQGRDGSLRVSGFLDDPVLEWIVGENLGDLYQKVRLAGIYEMLLACKLVKNNPLNIEQDG